MAGARIALAELVVVVRAVDGVVLGTALDEVVTGAVVTAVVGDGREEAADVVELPPQDAKTHASAAVTAITKTRLSPPDRARPPSIIPPGYCPEPA